MNLKLISNNILTENRMFDEINSDIIDNFGDLLMEYSGRECRQFRYWFEEKFDEFYKEGITEWEEGWEDFRNFAFNDSDDRDNDFWKYFGSQELNERFNVSDVMLMMVECARYIKDNFANEVKLTDITFNSERKIWNTLAWWATYTDIGDELRDGFKKRWESQVAELEEEKLKKDTGEVKRTICDICYDNKQIHACCSSCKGKMLCKSCYIKVDNECPFCRRVMIYDSKFFRPFVKLDPSESRCGCIAWRKSDEKEVWLKKLEEVCKEVEEKYIMSWFEDFNRGLEAEEQGL